MSNGRGPGTPEDLLRKAAQIEQATHRLALFLGVNDDWVRENRGTAIVDALAIFPDSRPLRRERDQAVIEAIRVLARELPENHQRKNHIMMRLSAASRQASSENWPVEAWEGQPPA